MTTIKSKFDGFFYGMGEMGPSAVDFFLRVYLLVFYNEVVGLSPELTGLALGIGVFWDAAVDPFIGQISDKNYYKRGHRRTMMFIGLVAIAICFMALWNPPAGMTQMMKFVYLLVTAAATNTAYSLFIVPFLSVANDLRSQDADRARWLGWRWAFLNIGALAGLGVPAFYLTQNMDQPYSKAALVLTLMMLSGGLISVWKTYQGERDLVESVTKSTVRLKEALQDRTFLKLLFGFFVVSVGLTLNSALAVYYYKQRLLLSEKEMQTVLLLFLVFFTISIPCWILLSRKFSILKLILVGGLILGFSNSLIYPLLPPQGFLQTLFWASFVGGMMVGVAVLLEIFLTQVMKIREIEKQQSVAGLYYGIWKTSGKISRAVALTLSGPILTWTREDASGTRLAHFFGSGVGLFFILGALTMIFIMRKGKIA